MASERFGRAVRFVSSLSPAEQETLAADLVADLLGSDDAHLIDERTDEEWADEIRRRLAEIEAGTAELIDVDVVIAELSNEARLR
ncbi:MAG: addiction module protein [Steroidobacteraceae bacterium]|jgi:putative addiction module component (TIGR02574 family)|nr:addiction module protein [Steroidobacteraceae bacterium]